MSQRPAAGPPPLVGILGALLGASPSCRCARPRWGAGGRGPRSSATRPRAAGGDLGTPTSTPPDPHPLSYRPRRLRPDQGGAGRGAPLAPHRDARHRRPRDRDRPPLQRLLHPGSPAGPSDSTSEGVFVFTSSVPTVAIGDEVRVDGQVQEFRPGCTPSCTPSSSDFDNLYHHPDRHRRRRRQRAPRQLRQSHAHAHRPRRRGRARPPRSSPTTPRATSRTGPLRPRERRDRLLREPGRDARAGQRRRRHRAPAQHRGDPGGRRRRGTGPASAPRAGASSSAPATSTRSASSWTTSSPPRPMWTSPTASPGPSPASWTTASATTSCRPSLCPRLQPARSSPDGQCPRRRTSWPWPPSTWRTSTRRSPARFAGLASLIVNGLQSPDILALEEVQDDNGPTNDALVDATQTYALLIQAIKDAGGPAYEVRQVNPRDDQDGGAAGGNIRVALLFRFDRGLCFVDRPGPARIWPPSRCWARKGYSLRTVRGGSNPPTPGATAASPWRGSSATTARPSS